MAATGDRITKRKDGLFQGMYTAQTPEGPKRKYIYGRKFKDVEQKLAEAMGDAARGLTYDAGTLTVGEYLTGRLDNSVRGTVRQRTYERYESIVRVHLIPSIRRVKLKASPLLTCAASTAPRWMAGSHRAAYSTSTGS